MATSIVGDLTVTITDIGDNRYTIEHETPRRSVTWTFELNKEFISETIEGRMKQVRTVRCAGDGFTFKFKILITYDNGRLVEQHSNDEETHEPIVYETGDADHLVMHMRADGVECRRYLRREAQVVKL